MKPAWFLSVTLLLPPPAAVAQTAGDSSGAAGRAWMADRFPVA